MSGKTMDAENHRLLLISSPAYDSCLETTENCTLQIQRKYQVLFVYHVPESPCPRPRVPRPRVPRLRVSSLRVPRPRVPRPRVQRPRVHVRESTSASPRPRVPVTESHVLDSYSQSRRPRLIFSHSLNFRCCVEFWWRWFVSLRRSFPDIWFSIYCFLLAKRTVEQKISSTCQETAVAYFSRCTTLSSLFCILLES